jgi:hypothetical protein
MWEHGTLPARVQLHTLRDRLERSASASASRSSNSGFLMSRGGSFCGRNRLIAVSRFALELYLALREGASESAGPPWTLFGVARSPETLPATVVPPFTSAAAFGTFSSSASTPKMSLRVSSPPKPRSRSSTSRPSSHNALSVSCRAHIACMHELRRYKALRHFGRT